MGFDTQRYLQAQKKAIEERLSHFSGRLYLEFGGKLLNDFHATRTLPGYDPNAKLQLLKSLKRSTEVIYCVSAKQLAEGKIRGDYGIDYNQATIRALETLKSLNLPIAAVVINRYEGENEALVLGRRLKTMRIPFYRRYEIEGYPNNLKKILSARGYGKDDYIPAKKKLVVVWGAGPGSGKLSTCLGQIYRDSQRKINSGYAKFETFPVWNLPLQHPINIAYEASTADLGDFNLVDPFHHQAYKKVAVNYNRDVEAFPIIMAILEKVLKKKNFTRQYKSPTDMGFNVLKEGMVNDQKLKEAAKKEIVFYLFRYRQEQKAGLLDHQVLDRMNNIMKRAEVGEEYLQTVPAARETQRIAKRSRDKGEKGIYCGAAIELLDGQVVQGKNSPLLHAEAATILNAIKVLAKISDDLPLISKPIIRQINKLRKQMAEEYFSLNCSEALLALAISAQTNPLAQKAQKNLKSLRGCFMHTTHRPSAADQSLFRKLGIWVSTDGAVA